MRGLGTAEKCKLDFRVDIISFSVDHEGNVQYHSESWRMCGSFCNFRRRSFSNRVINVKSFSI